MEPRGHVDLAITRRVKIMKNNVCAFFRFMKCWADKCKGLEVNQPLSERELYSGNGQPPKFEHPELTLRSLIPAKDLAEFQEKIMTIWPTLTARVFRFVRFMAILSVP